MPFERELTFKTYIVYLHLSLSSIFWPLEAAKVAKTHRRSPVFSFLGNLLHICAKRLHLLTSLTASTSRGQKMIGREK